MRALPNLNSNVQWGNSLVDSAYFSFDAEALNDGTALAKLVPFVWADGFPQIVSEGGFDAIIGNPPYIRIQNMVKYAPKEVAYYQSHVSPYSTARHDNFDKYAVFIERALMLLKPDGLLGYIVPNKFFTIKSGTALRRLLSASSNLNHIVHFGVHQVFAGKSTYTCVLLLSQSPLSEFTVEHVSDLTAWRRGEGSISERYPADLFDEGPWIFITPSVRSVFDSFRSRAESVHLDTVADILVGVQTSRDTVYIVHPVSETSDYVECRDRSGRVWKLEKKILRPALLDVPLQAFSQPDSNTYMIFPYRVEGGRAQLYTQEELQVQFPNTWDYLNSYKEDLAKRSVQNYTDTTWYRFGRSQSLTKFDGAPKLIWPVLSLEPRYAYDDNNIVFTGGGNGPYYALRPKPGCQYSIYYLLAILCHPIVDLMVTAKGSRFRGGYISHGKQFVADVPVRQINFEDPTDKRAYDTLVSRVQQLIAATEYIAQTKLQSQKTLFERQQRALRAEVNSLVEQLYEITAADLALLTSVAEDETTE